MNRKALIRQLEDNQVQGWDIIVIGGGATGLGIALDAVTRGYRTILFEQSDFTKGTSSRSTKLVHGGVRYMAQGDILLVKEALYERGLILRNAPHITANQEFVIPVYTYWDVFLYTVGLKFYDLLAGKLSLGKSYFINRSKTVERIPLLKSDGLKGGIVYHDGQFDDSRLALSIAGACVENGGTVLNYFRVEKLLKDDTGQISGVEVRDIESGLTYSVKSKLVINATGVFADQIHRMDNPSARATIKPSQGVHIVLDKSFLNSRSAIMIPKTDDGRVLFAIPWYGKVVVGTTDTPLNEISLEPKALDEEIDFILRTAGRYLTRAPLRKDVLCIFAGLRPLAANPDKPEATKEVSRRHKITLSQSRLLSIIGGKWTSYRRMAEETIDRAIKAGIVERRECRTRNFSFCSEAAASVSDHLSVYGDHASEIRKLIEDEPGMGEPVHPMLPYCRAEIAWIARNEMPGTLEDMLARRTRALFLDARASAEAGPVVAGIMAKELGFSGSWQENEVSKYNDLIKIYT